MIHERQAAHLITRRAAPVLAALAVLAAALAVPASAHASVYCGSRFALNEPLGDGASDFYVTDISCQGARRVVDHWFRARFPHHVDGWTFTGGYTVRANRRREHIRFNLFGTD